MTWSKAVTLWCDGEGCQEWFQAQKTTVQRAVVKAKEAGWTSPEWDEHLCPECSEE